MKLLTFIFIFAATFAFSQKKESYVLEWPKKEWKEVQHDEMPEFTFMLYTPPQESLENWTILGNSTSFHQVEIAPLDTFMMRIFRQTQQLYPTAKLSFLEKDEKSKFKTILFKIDVEEGVMGLEAQSQIMHITLGEQGLYSSYISVKKKEISEAEIKKWGTFLKKAKVILK